MGQFDDWAHKKIKQSQKKKARDEKKASEPKPKTFMPHPGNSNQFDNDGNPIFPQPRGSVGDGFTGGESFFGYKDKN